MLGVWGLAQEQSMSMLRRIGKEIAPKKGIFTFKIIILRKEGVSIE